MRARIKLIKLEPEGKGKTACHCVYRDGDLDWSIRPYLEPDGSQSVKLRGRSSLGADAVYSIPNSRNRYVDYEIRCKPATQEAELYVDGRLVATGFCKKKESKLEKGLQFGIDRDSTVKAHYALFEWKVLDGGNASGTD
jgi:hypothetical protein